MELPPPPPPPSLLAEGGLRRPQVTWAVLRSALGDGARAAPSSLELAVVGGLGLPPLTAGLVDAERPVALALVDPAPAGGAELVVGIPLTSGQEMVAALSAGALPPFTARTASGTGLTLLTAARARSGDEATIGVAGDYLVVSVDEAALSQAGAYVGRVLGPALGPGEAVELSFPPRSLSGPAPEWLRAEVATLEGKLVEKDEEGRQRHGGRAPDFGDPRALVAAFAGFGASLIEVVESAQALRLVADIEGGSMSLRAELAPRAEGPASELVRSLPRGDAVELLSLPAWTEGAVLFRSPSQGRSAGDGDAGASEPSRATGPGPSLLGDRVDAVHRARLDAWVTDIGAGLGSEVLVGIFSSEGSLGALALGPRGDGASLRQSVTTFPGVLAVPAVAEPIATFLGKVTIDRARTQQGPYGEPVARVTVRTERKDARTGASPLVLVAGSRGARVAAVLASSAADDRLAELLGGNQGSAQTPTLAQDPRVVRAVERGRGVTSAAVLVRLKDEGGRLQVGTVLAGTTGEGLWAEVSGPGALVFARSVLAGPP